MKRLLSFVVFCLFFCFLTYAQQTVNKSIIYLKNGEKYRGEIVLRTNDILMLKMEDDKRFQFQINEIATIKQENNIDIKHDDTVNAYKNNLSKIITLSGGAAIAPGALKLMPLSPTIGVSFAFGSNNLFKSGSFLGLGIGYESIISNLSNISFIPVFLQIHSAFEKTKRRMAFGLKAGYDFSINNSYKGGPMAEISEGMNYRYSSDVVFFVGLYEQIRQINGSVRENNQWGSFTSTSNTALYNIGLKASLIF